MLKDKTVLVLAYSAGLRVSEVVKLRMQDIHTKCNKSCLAIRVLKLQKFTLMSASGISDGLRTLWILEVNDNKKLQLEVSSRVVHKRSTSQNMPI